MADEHYSFDPDTLSFENADKKKGRRILMAILTQVLAALAVAVFVFLAVSYTVKSPKQKKIEHENQIMSAQYQSLVDRYRQTEKVMEDLNQRDKDIYRAIFEADPPKEDSSDFDYIFGEVSDNSIFDHVKSNLDSAVACLKKEEASVNELWYLLQNSNFAPESVPAIQPVDNKDSKCLVYGFGRKLDPIYKTPRPHYGIDFAAQKGTEVMAAAAGKVVISRIEKEDGLKIVIDHRNGFKTYYAHLSESIVRPGQKVKRGDVIGFVGNSGKSLTSHLHYAINYQGDFINPISFIFENTSPEQYFAIKRMAEKGGMSLD